MNMDSAETTRDLDEIVASPSSTRKMDPSLFQVRNNKDKNETEKDNE